MFLVNFDKLPDVSRSYEGLSGPKRAKYYNGDVLIVKRAKNTAEMHGNSLPSYTSSPLSEYLGSHIYEILGIPVHETIMGFLDGRLAVGCKDFRGKTDDLYEVRKLKNDWRGVEPDNTIATKPGDLVKLEEIFDLFENDERFDKALQRHFWTMIIVDILIDNNDRNNGNWGLISDRETNIYRIAPVYDNGNSFCTKFADERLAEIMDDEVGMIGGRTVFSVNGKQLSAKKMLKRRDPGLVEALKELVPLIGLKLQDMYDFIDAIPECEQGYTVMAAARKEYYKKCLRVRYEKLLKPAIDDNGYYTKDNFMSDSHMQQLISSKGITSPELWFDAYFSHGASNREEVLKILNK